MSIWSRFRRPAARPVTLDHLTLKITDIIEMETIKRQGEGHWITTGYGDSKAFAVAVAKAIEPYLQPDLMVDPTDAVLKMIKGDCMECGCPGYTCVDASNCIRSASCQKAR